MNVVRDMNRWLAENIAEEYATEDTGDHRIFGYYGDKVVFPLKSGELVWLSISCEGRIEATFIEVAEADVDREHAVCQLGYSRSNGLA